MKAYLKVPVEMAEFALRMRKTSYVMVYLACQFAFSGKGKLDANTISKISSITGITNRSIYRAFRWLYKRNWLGKDIKNGWYFYRGFNYIHFIEGWKFKRSGIMFREDLDKTKAFLIGLFIASLCKSGNRGEGSERLKRRSLQNLHPVSLSILQHTLNTSEKTASNYRSLAHKYGYIDMYQDLRPIKKLTVSDLKFIRCTDIEKIEVEITGYSSLKLVKTKQLIIKQGSVFVQLPNLINPQILITKRNLGRHK